MPLTALKHTAATPRPVPEFPTGWRGTLNALRVIALECRVAAREDLFQACALLSNSRTKAQDAYARALFRCLTEAIGSNAVFHRPGVAELSFDEAWLTRLLIASHAGDDASVAFLIRSRVPKMHQRHIAFLIKGIATH